jgi:outer membrane protein assembly factor BamB
MLALLGAGLALVTATAADWPQLRGPARDGISTETGLLRAWPEGGPRVVWRKPLGEGYSGLSVVGGRIYTMYGRGADEFVACLDAANGTEIWRFRIDTNWKDSMGNGPRSTPTVDGGTVYALSSGAKLVAIDAREGTRRWGRDLKAEYGAQVPRWGVSGSVHVEGDRVIVEVGGKAGAALVAFQREDGAEAWRSLSGEPGYSTPLAITVSGLRQIVVFSAKGLRAVAPKDGKLLWELPWETSYDVNAAMPIFVPPDRLFISSGYDVGGALLRIRVTEGKASVQSVWQNREMKNQFSTSVIQGGVIYGFDDKTLKAVNLETGETRWRTRGLGHGSLTVADGMLIVLGDSGVLLIADATGEAYKERARLQLFNGKTWTVPTLADGRLYVRDENELVALAVAQ